MRKNAISIFSKAPQLKHQWDFKKNKIDPNNTAYSSREKAYWICNTNSEHRWKASIKNRVTTFIRKPNAKYNVGCPWCSKVNAYPTNFYNLKVHLEKIGKKHLIKYWSKKNTIKITEVTHAEDKPRIWKCVNCLTEITVQSKEFIRDGRRARIYCSKCGPAIRGKSYTKGQIDRFGSIKDINPDIVKFWNYELNKKKPEDYPRYSHDKVWFKCNFGHVFKSLIYNQVKNFGCPKCYSMGSQPEARVYSELKPIYKKGLEWHKRINNKEMDIYIDQHKIGIELDGYPWHLKKLKKDLEKTKVFNDMGIKIIRVRDSKLPKIANNTIISNLSDFRFKDFKKLVSLIFKITKDKKLKEILKAKKFSKEQSYRKIISELPKPPFEKRLSYLDKKISSEFDIQKNFPLTPDHFSIGSSKFVWWKCKKNHSYKAQIYERTRGGKQKGTGCPYCSGRYADDNNNLYVVHPDLRKYFDLKLNKISSKSLTPYSEKVVNWLCPKGHKWKMSVKKMAYRKTKCLSCGV